MLRLSKRQPETAISRKSTDPENSKWHFQPVKVEGGPLAAGWRRFHVRHREQNPLLVSTSKLQDHFEQRVFPFMSGSYYQSSVAALLR